MLGLVTTLNGKAPVELRELPEPQPQRNEALVAVHAFSLNRGELRSVRNNGEGWVPGQDVAGVVLRQAEDGSGPPSWCARRRSDRRIRLGAARRGAGPSHGGAARQRQLLTGCDASGRWAHRAAHIASWRAAVGQARADHRCGRRRWHDRRAACGAIRRARDGGGWADGTRGGIEGTWRARRDRGHRQGARPLRADPGVGGGASLAQAIKLVEAKGTVVVYGNSSGEPTTLSSPTSVVRRTRVCRASAISTPKPRIASRRTLRCWCR